jgi:hypothetical protein
MVTVVSFSLSAFVSSLQARARESRTGDAREKVIDGKAACRFWEHLPQFIFDPIQALVFGLEKGAIGLQLRDAVVSSVRGSEEGDAPLRAVQAIYWTVVSIKQNSSSLHVLLKGHPSGVSCRSIAIDLWQENVHALQQEQAEEERRQNIMSLSWGFVG